MNVNVAPHPNVNAPLRHSRVYRVIFLIGVISLCGGIIGIVFLEIPLAHTMETWRFSTPNADSLVGSYFPGVNERGIVLLVGFGSDQNMM